MIFLLSGMSEIGIILKLVMFMGMLMIVMYSRIFEMMCLIVSYYLVRII